MTRVKYNKENSGKIIGRGGPRDIQERQRFLREESVRQRTREVEVESGLHPKMVGSKAVMSREEGPVDVSQFLHISEVKKKIEEAVEFTRKSEQDRYESGLRNLNDQLNTVRKERDMLKVELISKEEIYNKLQGKMDKIYQKVSDGSITTFIGKDRPELEDKIFIDPIDKFSDLDPHINVEEEPEMEVRDRNVGEDIDKLRKLLVIGAVVNKHMKV